MGPELVSIRKAAAGYYSHLRGVVVFFLFRVGWCWCWRWRLARGCGAAAAPCRSSVRAFFVAVLRAIGRARLWCPWHSSPAIVVLSLIEACNRRYYACEILRVVLYAPQVLLGTIVIARAKKLESSC